MENYSIVIPSYTVGPDAYQKIPEFAGVYGNKAVVIGGRRAMEAARAKIERALSGSPVRVTGYLWYGEAAGEECCRENAQALEQKREVLEADMIFAVGGGKAVDTAKLVRRGSILPYSSMRLTYWAYTCRA